jgi:short-subunit dehydrogenase
MKPRILLTGGSSGIGKCCYELLKDRYDIDAPTRQLLDLSKIEQIDSWDYSPYDVIINSAGCNIGTYLGFNHNDSFNQVQQIQTNFIAPLLIAKHYTSSRQQGQFIYISSASIDNPFVYNIVNASSKSALKYAIDVLRTQYKNFSFNEICPGKTKTNMLNQNYMNTRSSDEIELEYSKSSYLLPTQVASLVEYCIDNRHISKIDINP